MLGGHYRRKKSEHQEDFPPLKLGECLAKTWKKSGGEVVAGRDVYSHCMIVAKVAQSLIDRLPEQFAKKFFPKGVGLVAAEHDIGKISPTFQRKIYKNLTDTPPDIWEKLQTATFDESDWGGHAGVSQSTLKYLKAEGFIPEIVGQHHGFSPNLGHKPPASQVFGGQPWLEKRLELSEKLSQSLQLDFPYIKDPLQAKVVAGLTTVADWIGSSNLFDDPNESWQQKISASVDWAGFVPPQLKKGLGFKDVFDFDPWEIQSRMIDLSKGPGVYILEAPMGVGKTEAALYVAYRILEKGEASGIYFALPTQLTSEKIHERMEAFLKKILTPESLHGHPILCHSQAWIIQTLMGKEGAPGHSWFSQSKRGILAPFAVGTVDQALMAVLHVKHGFVRTFGLIGKVVILDEVHTYDAYTGTIIDELVDALRQIGCTVIILSATLTQLRRQQLLKNSVHNNSYPLITAEGPEGDDFHEEGAIAPIDLAVKTTIVSDDSDALEEAINRAEGGEQVLWIENTVAEAQDIYLILSARARELGVQVGLLHSRFIKEHRKKNEDYWVARYGKGGWAQRSQQGRILVGTQVLEQSLDIDADFLVTRLAPTDMLLQRTGRLWRHDNPHRNPKARPEIWVLAPELAPSISKPEKYFGKSAKVYMPYVLCRTLEVWRDLERVRLPIDIRNLIEATYQERSESGAMASHLYQVEQQRRKLHNLALVGLSKIGQTKPDENVATRYSEQDTLEVLLFRKVEQNQSHSGQKGTWVTLLNGERLFLPHNGMAFGPWIRRKLAAKLNDNIVAVADYLAPAHQNARMLGWLKDYLYLGPPDQSEANVRVGMVRDDQLLVGLKGREEPNDKYDIYYSADSGYWVKKRE
ncbi:MAG: CRISPR-associated helicase Cas3' [Chlamydiota bacterium]